MASVSLFLSARPPGRRSSRQPTPLSAIIGISSRIQKASSCPTPRPQTRTKRKRDERSLQGELASQSARLRGDQAQWDARCPRLDGSHRKSDQRDWLASCHVSAPTGCSVGSCPPCVTVTERSFRPASTRPCNVPARPVLSDGAKEWLGASAIIFPAALVAIPLLLQRAGPAMLMPVAQHIWPASSSACSSARRRR